MGMLLTSLAALAADPFVDAGFILSPPDSGAWMGGLGAPSVEYDPVNRVYLMFFESPAPDEEVPEDCANSYRIGRAISEDGLSWVVDEEPVVTPELGVETSLRACSVSQPGVVYDGSMWYLFFTQSGVMDAYGINTPHGVAWAASTDGASFTVMSDVVVPSADSSGIGLASATVHEENLVLVFNQENDLRVGTRPLSGGDWTLEETPILDHEALGDRAGTWVFGATVNCDPENEAAPLSMIFGADTTDGVRSLGEATGVNVNAWTASSDALDNTGLDTSVLNHWERLLWDGGGARLWYSKTDDSTGLKAIGVATAGAPSGPPLTRGCLEEDEPVDTGDSGDTGDTADSGDTGVDTADSGQDTADSQAGGDSDTGSDGGKGGEEGCGCTSGAAPAAGSVALLAGLALRRRRARA